MATLVTPSCLRKLRRALYTRAKSEPDLRFYSLYDKICRADVLEHAYLLACANAGAPGPDGQSFEDIEADGRQALLEELCDELTTKTYRPGPVRRVYIPKLSGGERPLGIPSIRDRVVQTAVKLILEPIFEADFDADSYGFRPKRDAHQALDAIGEALGQGMTWVIDADISAYFDEIPHDRLMKVVAERVADGTMLALVKMFLQAPIVDERDGGRPRCNRKGTPQGGVVSPLLANIYLDLLDRNFRSRVQRGELRGRLVRYADDFVILVPRRPDKELAWVGRLMSRLGLELHPSKTRVLNVYQEDFTFLGHTVRWRSGRMYLDISREAQRRIRDHLRWRTRQTWWSLERMTHLLNLYVRGGRHYFRRVRRRSLSKLDYFVEQRIARWWARKHSKPRPAWSLVHRGALYRRYGLERWNLPRALRPVDATHAR